MRLPKFAATAAVPVAALLLPAALAAQAAPAGQRPPGCRGTFVSTGQIGLPGPTPDEPILIPDYPVITDVIPGSPAERAGMRVNDVIILQGPWDLVGNPPQTPALAGDTVVFTVLRDRREMQITVVMGRWDPPQPVEGVDRVCR